MCVSQMFWKISFFNNMAYKQIPGIHEMTDGNEQQLVLNFMYDF